MCDKKLTREQVEDYADSDCEFCPYCDSPRTQADTGLDQDGTRAWRKMSCNDCGWKWDELFSFTGLGYYDDADSVVDVWLDAEDDDVSTVDGDKPTEETPEEIERQVAAADLEPYFGRGATGCPYCHAKIEDHDGRSQLPDGTQHCVEYECDECGGKWAKFYELTRWRVTTNAGENMSGCCAFAIPHDDLWSIFRAFEAVSACHVVANSDAEAAIENAREAIERVRRMLI